MKKRKRGKFIVFEGLDGAGEETQMGLLEKSLHGAGIKVYRTSEPSHNFMGGLIRSLLRGQWVMSNTGIQLLYCADRAHHLEAEILPALEKGQHVICGRYIFSTLAFGSLNNDHAWLETLNEKFPAPDLTFFLDVKPRECMRRIEAYRSTKEFFEKEETLEKVYRAYQKLIRDKKFKHVYAIDGEQPKEKVAEKILAIVNKVLR